MEPIFSASMSGTGQTLDVPVIELFRELVLRTGSAEGFVEILYRGNVVPSRLGEEVDFVTPPNIVGLLALLDERLPVADRVRFCARGVFEIERVDVPKLLDYVNGHLSVRDALRLERPLSESELDAVSAKLGGANDYLPVLALAILNHVAEHRLERFEAREVMPEIDLGPPEAQFWHTVRTNTGPGEILSDVLPTRADALFARGLVEFWRGDRAAAHDVFLQANRSGEVRADRWLKALGVALAPRLARRPAPKRPRYTAALEAALVQRERLDDPAARAHAEATRALALTIAMRDAGAATDALARWPFGAPLDHKQTANALSLILEHGDPTLVGRAWSAVKKRVDPDVPVAESHVAYNLACAAAVLADHGPVLEWKAEMLAWLRVAKGSGDHPRDAVEDSDFARFHTDPDLLALAREP